MGRRSKMETPDNSDEDSGEAFTDGDFDDFDEDDADAVNLNENSTSVPVNDTVNMDVKRLVSVTDEVLNENEQSQHSNGLTDQLNGSRNGDFNDSIDNDGMSVNENGVTELRRDSNVELSPSIVGILGDQHNHAEQRLAARRAARAEAREIRMRELERQQREQEDHADKAYDMYAETVGRRSVGVGAGAGGRLAALSPAALHSPRRSSEDSADDVLSLKDLRHELKEMEEKFRKAMILNAQLDNDKAASKYQLELLRDRIEELQEEYAQLQREHKEKCSVHERLKREHASTERELSGARAGVRARDAAAARAGRAFVDAALAHAPAPDDHEPALELVSLQAEQLLNDAGEGTLDVRLQNLLNSKQSLESEVRKLKLQLNEERAARQNGAASHHDQEYQNEMESLRKCLCEAKARAARAEAEAALQAAGAARLEAQVARLRARHDQQDEHEDHLKHERRRLQREAREALIRVEELETENSHLTKRLDKLKNAKSALLKDL